MYNKFRTVSSILVVAEFCIPLLAILALKEIITNPRILIEKKRESIISFALTGGISLLFFLFVNLFFTSTKPTKATTTVAIPIPIPEAISLMIF